MSYQYDLFISYRRVPILQEWLASGEFFDTLLKSYLSFELGRPPKVFRDCVNLRPGDNFPREIETALRTSRCLLPIGTGDYFASAWCRAELETFLDRATSLGHIDIIVPLAWHDWETPPEEISSVLIANFRHLAYVGARLDPQTTVPFQTTMGAFCASLAMKIRGAPPFDPSWKAVVPNIDDVREPVIKRPRQET